MVTLRLGRLRCLLLSSKILFHVKPWAVVLFIVGSVLNVGLNITEMFIIKYLVDAFQQWSDEGAYRSIINIVLMTGAILYFQGIIGTVTALCLSQLNEVSLYEQERLILEKTMRLRMIDIESSKIKDMNFEAQRISLIDNISKGMNYISSMIQVAVLVCLVTFVGHWLLSLVALIAFGIQMATQSKASIGLEEIVRKQATSRRFTSYLANLLTDVKSAKEIRVFRIADYLKKKWQNILSKDMNDVLRGSIRGEIINIMPSLLVVTLSGLVAGILIALLGYKGESAGQFMLLFTATSTLFTQMPTLARLHGELKKNSMIFERFKEYLSLREETKPSTISDMTGFAPPSITVKDLTFEYPGAQQPTINNISFTIRPGQTVAIVGENGAGKSTLVKLLTGIYEPDGGKITWSSNNRTLELSEVRYGIRVVFQEFVKLLRSIRENVALGNPQKISNDAEIDFSLSRVGLEELNGSKDEQLGPQFGGIDLSGGQWQRLAIARAYLREGICIFFDEPTSALDAKTEQETLQTLFNLTKGQTAVIVTHRLSSARMVDWILVVKHGQVIEEGNHDTLLAKDGEYARLYKMQSSWYE